MLGKLIIIILHALFWIASIYIVNGADDIEIGYFGTKQGNMFWPMLYGTIFNMVIFYSTVYYLIPQFFNRKKRRQFYLLSVALILICSLFEAIGETAYAINLGLVKTDKSFIAALMDLDLNLLLTITVHIFYFIVAFGYRYPIDKRIQEAKERELEKQQLNSELKYLKAQMDPHTLFNGINSIYHLIDDDGEKAKEVLLKFSNLMRYQLYECEDDFVNIDQEIQYLNNYIDLNKIRKEEDAVLEIDIQGDLGSCQIAPLIFTPFIENAFKYLSSHTEKEKNRLRIVLDRVGEQLVLTVHNTFDLEVNGSDDMASGIGLDNVRNRLDLIYGKHYQLNIKSEFDNYMVELKIPVEPIAK